MLSLSLAALGSPARAQMGAGSLGDMGQQLGISGDQLQQLQQSVSQGGLNQGEMQRLCAGVAAKHMSDTEIESVARSLGLSATDIEQLKNCAAQGPTGRGAARNYPGMPMAEPTPTAPSSIETRFRELNTPYKLYAAPSVKDLKQFGYDLFSSEISTFAPVADVSVDKDYVLGPGDGLNVILWGRVNRTLDLTVQRDGTVLMPQIGPIQVAGLTFGQAKKLIEGRANQITGVQADVTMGQVRSIQVFVIGKVHQPGLYTVSALSHVSNALVAAGGISRMGSLRRIEVRRGNQVIAHIDLYNMLLHGDAAGDIRLRSRDVIFVPVIGPVSGVIGDVKSPAIYELKGRQTLASVLKMAGGVSAFGYSERVQVERIQNHQRRIALDVNLASREAPRFTIDDGDLIKVFTVLPQKQDVVRVKGNVNRPGTFQWYQGMRVSDLVREAQGVSDHSFFGYAQIRRFQGPSRKVEVVRFDLKSALSGHQGDDKTLLPEDTLTIYAQSEVAQAQTVAIFGQVRRPGRYPFTPGMGVRDLIYDAGGLEKSAARDRAQLMRTEIAKGASTHYVNMVVNLSRALAEGQTSGVRLRPDDEVFIQQASNWHKPWKIALKGEVQRPGPYPIFAGERLATVLRASGGFRSDAYLPAAVFIRKSVKELQQQELNQARNRLEQEMARLSLMPHQAGAAQQENLVQSMGFVKSVLAQTTAKQAVGRVVIHLSSLDRLEKSPDNIVLQNEDELLIPSRPASVQVLGQVYNPNAIVYQPNFTVETYIQRAGGPTEGADTDHVYVVRADGSILTEQGLLDTRKNRIFPMLPMVSGVSLMQAKLQPGDTIYIPEKLLYISNLQYARDITQVIANSVQGIAMLAIVATNL